jgi:probable rRNA maturation factor
MLSLSVQYASRRTAPDRAQCRRWVKAAQAALAKHPPLLLTLRFVDQAEGRQLNLAFRQRDYATNVLTFSYPEPGQVHADIVLCVPVIEREARQQKKTLKAHFAHLVVHGVLHAHGMDHENPADAASMEARERTILARFRLEDPYA